MGYRLTGVLEAPWVPYFNGRAPTRCEFMLKRLRGRGSAAAQQSPGGTTAGGESSA